MISRLIPILFSLLPFSTQAALFTYGNEANLIANGGTQALYDFEVASGFPISSYDYNPAPSLIGEFDGIQFDATTITPGQIPTSGVQAMSGYSSSQTGTYSAANLDFSSLSRRIIGFGFYGLDLIAGESIHVSADFRLAGIQSFDIYLGDAATDFDAIYFGAYDANDSIRSLSLLGIKDNNNSAWYIDDLTLLSTAAVPLPSALPLFLGGLVLLGRFCSGSRKLKLS